MNSLTPAQVDGAPVAGGRRLPGVAFAATGIATVVGRANDSRQTMLPTGYATVRMQRHGFGDSALPGACLHASGQRDSSPALRPPVIGGGRLHAAVATALARPYALKLPCMR